MPITLDGSAGMTAPQGAVYNGLATTTATNPASGTSVDFTGIPLWVKRITVMFNGVSLSGSANFLIQIGSGTVTTSGYVSTSTSQGGTDSTANATSTSGFISRNPSSGNVYSGAFSIMNITGYTWVCTGVLGSGSFTYLSGGTGTLTGSLDRVRITSSGTDTFDAGTINVMYE